MTHTVLILVALGLGLAIGAGLAAAGVPSSGAISVAQVVGSIWLDALRMTIIPLVFSLLVTGIVAAAGTAALGGIAARAVLWFGVLLLASAIFSAIITPLLLAWLPLDVGDAASLRSGASAVGEIPPVPSLAESAAHIIPSNPIAAAAEGQMLQFVVFTLFFGLAATRIAPERRERLTALLQAVVDVMLVVVHWVLRAAPVGVLALAFVLGSRVGLSAAGVVAHYVVLVSAICILVGGAMYLLVRLSGLGIARFARAALPAQVVAMSTQSSLASLPAMIESAQQNLGAAPRVAGLVLPLAVSVFRVTSPAANLAVVLFMASVYGIEPGPLQLAAGAVVATVMSLAVVSLPQASFFTAIVPIAAAMGVPIELLPVLFAVEMIPDVFRTVSNVTADLAVTAIVALSPTRPLLA